MVRIIKLNRLGNDVRAVGWFANFPTANELDNYLQETNDSLRGIPFVEFCREVCKSNFRVLVRDMNYRDIISRYVGYSFTKYMNFKQIFLRFDLQTEPYMVILTDMDWHMVADFYRRRNEIEIIDKIRGLPSDEAYKFYLAWRRALIYPRFEQILSEIPEEYVPPPFSQILSELSV